MGGRGGSAVCAVVVAPLLLTSAPGASAAAAATAAAAAAAATALRTAGWSCSVFYNSSAKAIRWWMLLYRTLTKVTCTNMTKSTYVVLASIAE